MADKFVEHLDRLYAHYGVDVSNRATPDQILSGLKPWPRQMNFDETLMLIKHVVEDLVELRDKYGKQNILVDGRLTRFLEAAIKWRTVEYKALAWKVVKESGLTVPDGPVKVKLLKQIGPFLNGL